MSFGANPSGTSIKRRLVTTIVISQLLLAAGLMSVVIPLIRQQLIKAFDAALNSRAMSIVPLLPEDESDNPFDSKLISPLNPKHADLYEVKEGRKTLARSPNWPTGWEPGEFNGNANWNFKLAGRPYRAVLVSGIPLADEDDRNQILASTLTVFYGADATDLQAQVLSITAVVAIASFVLATGTAWFAALGIRRGLAPLSDLAKQASTISAQNWEFRSSAAARETQELAPLTQALENMLAGLRHSFAQQQEFVGNAAHELKTPVAIVKSTLQSLVHKPRSTEEYRIGVAQSLVDLARLETLLHWMLRLARAEQWAIGGARRDLEAVDVAVTCQEAIDRLQGLAKSREVSVTLRQSDTAVTSAHPEDLMLVWSNLLDNAIRYSPEGCTVCVAVEKSKGKVTVSFEDRGPGIPAEELSRVFSRFHRVDSSRSRESGGYGLGLAIAKALVEAYRGSITAQHALPHGTRIVVELPALPNL
jgi:signal transduction histidine kinase